MAIAFARMNIHSRSKGHNAVGAAAYRSASKIHDKQTGETFDYTKKPNVVHSQVILPDGGADKFKDRELLWNTIERIEKRKDSQLAREVIVALPKELSLGQQIDLAKKFAMEHFVSKGLVADINIHLEDGNPHAHIMTTTRRLLGEHFDIKKARDLNPIFSNKPSQQNGHIALKDYWGSQWGHFQNGYFEENNIDLSVDQNHIISQVHAGRIRDNASFLERVNEVRAAQSKHIAEHDPEAVINLLSARQTVFSTRDIDSVLLKATDTAEAFTHARAKVLAHRGLIPLGLGDDGRERFSTRYAMMLEHQLESQAQKLKGRYLHAVNAKRIDHAIGKHGLSDEQAMALRHVMNSGDLSIITSRPGTGKTYMLGAAREVWEGAGYRVLGTAVSGIASQGLHREAKINANVIAGLRYGIEQGKIKLTEKDILVMDEAGMTDLYDMSALVQHVREAGAKIVLVGDHRQVQPIGPGAPFRAMLERVGFVEMTEIRRQKVDWQREATEQLSLGNTAIALDAYQAKDRLHHLDTQDEAIGQLVACWSDQLTHDRLSERIILAHRNVDIDALNAFARSKLIEQGLLSADGQTITTKRGDIELTVNDRILFLKNNKTLGVKNGHFASVVSIDGHKLVASITEGDSQRFVEVDLNTYNHISHGYAATVHKLQGVTVDEAYMYAGGRAWNRNLSLVAMSRHRFDLHVYADKETHKTFDKLKKSLGRSGFKDSVLNYPVSFALRRGFDPDSVVSRAVDHLSQVKNRITDKWLYLVNYQAYLERQAEKEKAQLLQASREDARIVASYVDMGSQVSHRFRLMQNDLSSKQQIHEHPKYNEFYEFYTRRNQLAYSIYKNANKYEQALKANELDLSDIKPSVTAYLNEQRTQQFIQAYQSQNRPRMEKLGNEIQQDIKNHYMHLAQYIKDTKYKLSDLTRSIKSHAQIHAYKRLATEQRSPEAIVGLNVIKRLALLEQSYKDFWREAQINNSIEQLTEAEKSHVHQLSVERDQLAHQVLKDKAIHKTAIDAFYLSEDILEKYAKRYEARQCVNDFIKTDAPYRQVIAARIKSDIKLHYPYIDEFGLDWKPINITNWQYQQRKSFIQLSKEDRDLWRDINAYKASVREAGKAWSRALAKHERGIDTEHDRKIMLAQHLSARRDQLAYKIQNNLSAYENVLPLNKVNAEKLKQHHDNAGRMKFVERYVSETRPLYKSQMASFIRTNMKAYYGALNVKQVDLSSLYSGARHHQYLHEINQLSPDSRASFQVLEKYDERRIKAGHAWAKVKQYKESQSIDNKQLNLLIENAKHLTQQRNLLASDALTALYKDKQAQLVKSLGIDCTRLEKASKEYHAHQLVINYLNTTSVIKRDQYASDILHNKRTYRYLFENKVSWSDLYAHKAAFDRRNALATLSTDERALWRVVDTYSQAKLDSAKAWKDYFNAVNEKVPVSDAQRLFCQQLSLRRNELAYQIALAPEKYATYLSATRLTGENIEKHAIAYSKHLSKSMPVGLSAKPDVKPSVKPVYQIKKDYEQKIKRYDIDRINEILNSDVEGTYTAIFGEPKKRTSRELRYDGGLIVTLKGKSQGAWYDFSGGGKFAGGGPIQAIQRQYGFDFKKAIEHAASMAGLTYMQATDLKPIRVTQKVDTDQEKLDEAKALEKRIASAKYYYESARPIDGTLGEQYLRETRGVPGDISEFKYHDRIRDDKYIKDAQGKDKKVTTYHPGIVIASRDVNNNIKATQTILLDPQTANKADKDKVGVVKRSRGVVSNTAALVHVGTTNKVVLAEGPETGATVAALMPEAYVYITLGNFKNAARLAWLAEKHGTDRLHIAADNDKGKSRVDQTIIEVATTWKREHSIKAYQAIPNIKGYSDKVDFNDVLKQLGLNEAKKQLANMKLIPVSERKEVIDESIIRQRLQSELPDQYKQKEAADKKSPDEKDVSLDSTHLSENQRQSLIRYIDNQLDTKKAFAELTGALGTPDEKVWREKIKALEVDRHQLIKHLVDDRSSWKRLTQQAKVEFGHQLSYKELKDNLSNNQITPEELSSVLNDIQKHSDKALGLSAKKGKSRGK